MKPNHFGIRVKPDGSIWLTLEKPRERVKPIKDITNDVLFCLCAELSYETNTLNIERSIKFSDGMVCKITAELEEKPNGN